MTVRAVAIAAFILAAACNGSTFPLPNDALASGEGCTALDTSGCELACKRDVLRACLDAGSLKFAAGVRGSDVAMADAFDLYGRACTKGLSQACGELGRIASTELRANEGRFKWICARGAAVDALTSGCGGRDPASCGALAEMYDRGVCVTADPARAKAARSMGVVPADPANDYLRRCTNGVVAACEDLGAHYARLGNGPLAAAYLSIACDAPRASACYALRDIYSAGKILPRDPARAEVYGNKALEARLATFPAP